MIWCFILGALCKGMLIYSGSLNTLRDKEFTEAIEAAIATSEVGVVFNFLSDCEYNRAAKSAVAACPPSTVNSS